jgi:hypothetical protein
MINGAQNSLLALDITTVNNKAAVSEFLVQQFTAAHIDFGSEPLRGSVFAHNVITGVDATQGSVAAAQAAIIDFIQMGDNQMGLVGVAGDGSGLVGAPR